jgi:hypothetical protein
MRYTLIAGLVCLPTVALLASAALALLVSKLRHAVNRRFRDLGTAQAEMGRPMAVRRHREGIRDGAPLSSVPAGRLHVAAQLLAAPKNVSTPR